MAARARVRGTHGRAGYSHGKPYSAAVDISVRNLGTASIHRLLSRLRSAGFAAWYRRPGHDGWPYGHRDALREVRGPHQAGRR